MEINPNDTLLMTGERSPRKRSYISAFCLESEKIDKMGGQGMNTNKIPKEILIQYAINILKKPPQNRTSNDILVLEKCTEDIKFFKEYKEKNQSHIHTKCCKSMQHLHLKINETVFEIDTIGSAFYVILKGSVRVLVKAVKNDNPPSHEESKQELSSFTNILPIKSKTRSKRNFEEGSALLKLRHCITSFAPARQSFMKIGQSPLISAFLSNNTQSHEDNSLNINESDHLEELNEVNILWTGSSFGELALLSNKPRAATIICREDCDFAVLEKEDFKKILKSSEEKKLLEEMNFFASLSIFKNWNFNLVKMLYVNTQTKQYNFNELVYEEDEESEDVFILQKGTFIITKTLIVQNVSNIKKWGKLKELYSDESKYLHKEIIQLGVLNINESFGEEDLILNRKRAYSVQCKSADGQLRIINKKNFFQRVMRDETTAKMLEEKVKKKEEWYKNKFQEISALKEQLYLNLEEKKNLENNHQKIKKHIQLPKFFCLKKSMIKLAQNQESQSFAHNHEKDLKSSSDSFIFKSILALEERTRKTKNIQQMRIQQFLTRVPKPKKDLMYTFSSNLFSNLSYSKDESSFKAKKDQGLTISLSSPKINNLKNDFNINETNNKNSNSKMRKKLMQNISARPSSKEVIKNNNLNYSECYKKYMIDSVMSKEKSFDSYEKEQKSKFYSKNEELKKNNNESAKDRRYIITSPPKTPVNFKVKTPLNIREKDILNTHILKYFKNKIKKKTIIS